MAGLRDFRHDLRHTFASHAAKGRESLPMIGKLLGHRCIKSTARYAHLDDAHLIDAADEIGRRSNWLWLAALVRTSP
jgi:integrase